MKYRYFFAALLSGLFLCSSAQQRCASDEVLKNQMRDDPIFAQKVRATEKSFADYVRKGGDPQKGKPPSLTIPVIVHVVYNTAAQNISDAQIASQIDVLNEDFSASNDDYNNYDAGYGAVKGDADISFCLVQVVRRQTTHKSFPISDGVKFTKRGGSDAINPMNALNIWVCNLGQNLLGYAQFPGGSPETFGVVCHYLAFGRGSQFPLFANYNLGRTMTHEVGHCLGLRHIWGDANCGNDFVDDTPLHNSSNFGCPAEGHLSTCSGTPLEMWMNYMDYTDDRCMYFLTDGQVSRMDFFIDSDPQINSILQSSCTQTSKNGPVTTNNKPGSSTGRVGVEAFMVYPNITTGTVNLQFQARESGNSMLTVYDVQGAEVMKLALTVNNGINTRQFDMSALSNGLYIIKLNDGGVGRTQRVVVNR